MGTYAMVAVSAIAAFFEQWSICISFGLSSIVMAIWNVGAMIVTELKARDNNP